ncbi:MAG TPA: hypothetical protein VLT58_17685, partial [Polyangia bacterium]|nr:hypothetical protein [Polyangia bacterium]
LTDGGSGTGGLPATGGSGASGGVAGSSSGGRAGSAATGGAAGGTAGRGGTGGTGGAATGGSTGTGGVIGTGGVPATGGAAGSGSGGTGGTAGSAGGGGSVSTGGASGAAGGAAGRGGAGGAAGGGAYVCPLGGALNCSSTGALKLPGGQVTDFSALEWNSTSAQWCDPDGLRGRVFNFAGPNSPAPTTTVDTTARNLRLDVAPKDWAGGGVVFESCVNASGYTALQFTASLGGGSLAGCNWQVQLQTQDERGSTDVDPTGGTCTSNSYRYPAVLNLAAPSTSGTVYTEAFTAFNNPSAIPTATQVVGIQWQVNSTSTNGCTAQLRIDNIKFQ